MTESYGSSLTIKYKIIVSHNLKAILSRYGTYEKAKSIQECHQLAYRNLLTEFSFFWNFDIDYISLDYFVAEHKNRWFPKVYIKK